MARNFRQPTIHPHYHHTTTRSTCTICTHQPDRQPERQPNRHHPERPDRPDRPDQRTLRTWTTVPYSFDARCTSGTGLWGGMTRRARMSTTRNRTQNSPSRSSLPQISTPSFSHDAPINWPPSADLGSVLLHDDFCMSGLSVPSSPCLCGSTKIALLRHLLGCLASLRDPTRVLPNVVLCWHWRVGTVEIKIDAQQKEPVIAAPSEPGRALPPTESTRHAPILQYDSLYWRILPCRSCVTAV